MERLCRPSPCPLLRFKCSLVPARGKRESRCVRRPDQGNDGRARLLYFDTRHNDSFALLHHAAYDDARPVSIDGIATRRLAVRLLTPVDLAVSKLSRFSVQDQDDIRALARHGLVTAAALRKRAEAALPEYVDNLERIRNSIDIACKQADEITRRKAGNGTPS